MNKQLALLPEGAGWDVSFDDGRFTGPLDDAPIVVSYGVGVDSTAMLIELCRRGIRPDKIIVALVGSDGYGNEHRRFYSYLPLMARWLHQVGFPEMTFVQYRMKRKAKHFHYESLAGNCLANRTLPSISFRRNHSCSLKFKGEQIDKLVNRVYGSQPCYRFIGYDSGEMYRTKKRFSAKSQSRPADVWLHPLQVMGYHRDDCERIIADAGLPSPGQSSCVFCASMKPQELHELFPDELWRIVIIEANAQPKLKTINGLWGHEPPMTTYIVEVGLLPSDLVQQCWDKWSAEERPPELRDNPDAVADEVLFEESSRWAALSGYHLLPTVKG